MNEEEMIEEIKNYGICYICDSDGNCKQCNDIEACYWRVDSRINSEYAESIGYGGYDTEDEFWEQLFD